MSKQAYLYILTRSDTTEIFVRTISGEILARGANLNRELAIAEAKTFVEEEGYELVDDPNT